MATETIAALIGVAGIIAGAVITSLGPDLWNRFFSGRAPSEAIGQWRATWTRTESDAVSGRELTDEVTVKRTALGQLSGSARVQFESGEVHEYKLDGWESQYTLTFAYSGVDLERNLVGVVILKKSIVNQEMIGQWWQYTKDGGLVGGATKWTKI